MKNAADIFEFVLNLDSRVLKEDNKELIDLLLDNSTIFSSFERKEMSKDIKIFLYNISVFQHKENLKIKSIGKKAALKYFKKLSKEETNEILKMLVVFTFNIEKETAAFSNAVGTCPEQAKIKIRKL